MINSLEEGNRFPLVHSCISLFAHRQCQHQIKVRQPCFAATFPCKYHLFFLRNFRTDLIRKLPEVFKPVLTRTYRVTMIRVITQQSRTGLIHINSVDCISVNSTVTQWCIFVLPELSPHTHWGSTLITEYIIDMSVYFPVSVHNSMLNCIFFCPAFCGCSPKSLIHVNNWLYAFLMSFSHSRKEWFLTFPRRDILRESVVIWTTVPPVPEDIYGQAEPLFYICCRNENIIWFAPVPDPQGSIFEPLRRQIPLNPAFPCPALFWTPIPVYTRSSDPVTLKSSYNPGIWSWIIGRWRIKRRQIMHPVNQSIQCIKWEGKVFNIWQGVIWCSIKTAFFRIIQCKTLKWKTGIYPFILSYPAFNCCQVFPGIFHYLSHPLGYRKIFITSLFKACDPWE